MSSNEEDYNDNDNHQTLKKRKIQRACDICRRKKIRCDGGQMPGNRCSNCTACNFECTYVEAAKKRGPPKGYVERLEGRIEKLEKVLTKLHPNSDILKEIDSVVDTDAWLVEYFPRPAEKSHSVPLIVPPRHPCDIATSVIRKVSQPVDFQVDDDLQHIILADNLGRLQIGDVEKNRFFGKSSGAMLVHAAMELKNEATGGQDDLRRPILASKRDRFWIMAPWERSTEEVPKASFIFPEPDLINHLIDLYFSKVNIFWPLLHRPTFEKAVVDEYHLRDDGFASVLLLVCAVASRFSDDPRTLLDGVEDLSSAGWRWYQQVQTVRRSVLAPPSLCDLQYYCLSVIFLQGACAPQQCWTLVGIGIRMAQDVGAHRKKYNKELTVEEELWKRGFWVMVSIDRMVSSALGRPCAIQDEDFDLDFPIECDDEYWEHPDPAKRFKQPPNKPSYVTGFVTLLKLNKVLTIILRTIYSINRSKVMLGFVGKQWEQHIVAELDSALNKWVDSIPDHLRWDPNRENTMFFQQSASIYCTYYYIQILIHRSFIPSPRKPSPLSFPSLAICTNAARSCSHIIDGYRRRGLIVVPHIQIAIFTAGVVLLLSLWNSKRFGVSTDSSKEMEDVHKCMQALRLSETRWSSAGRLWDIMYELAFVGDLQLPNPSPPVNHKRDRGSDSPVGSAAASTSPPPLTEGPRAIAGTRRVAAKTQLPLQSKSEPSYSLPVYSNELGNMPINGQGHILSQMLQQQLPPYWDANSVSEVISSSMTPSYPYPLPSAPISLDMDLFNQMDFNYDPSLAQPASSSLQVPCDNRVVDGGNLAMGMQQPTEVMPAQAPFGGVGQGLNTREVIDNDAVVMWSNPPSGFDLDDWGIYLSNVSELTHGTNHLQPDSSGS
ncbi:Transcriptional activator protein acu-15 [Termitomyces sp. T112]|nr:Transcriptional activator protein acu-15 [Termitomyces sp. T112]